MSRLLLSLRFAPYCADGQLLARTALPVVERDGVWYEAFAKDCWLARGRNAQIQYGHNAHAIGKVDVVAAGSDGWWHADAHVDTDDLADDSEVLARIKVGAPISVGFDPIHHDDNLVIRLRRHDLAELKHLAILLPGEIPAYEGAKILSIRRLADRQAAPSTSSASSGVDWRTVLPPGYEAFRDVKVDPQPGDELTLGSARHGIVWDGQRFSKSYGRAA